MTHSGNSQQLDLKRKSVTDGRHRGEGAEEPVDRFSGLVGFGYGLQASAATPQRYNLRKRLRLSQAAMTWGSLAAGRVRNRLTSRTLFRLERVPRVSAMKQ
jgi:hypothetical protein